NQCKLPLSSCRPLSLPYAMSEFHTILSIVSCPWWCHAPDAGLALNLINKHRKEGYIFALFRVADAHVQHLVTARRGGILPKNASIAYLTLDVLETQCPVISRKHWSSCEHRPFLSITASNGHLHSF
uniref:Histidine-rich glycoprotein n=1 Tax=Naja naja TaxID=35670 RepID=A0A8C6XQD1_NAJNA